MKEFTEAQVDALIRLKFGQLAYQMPSISYVSDETLGRLFKASRSQIRRLYLQRFEANKERLIPILERIQQSRGEIPRQRWGYRFLKVHELQWLISHSTLRQQTSMSLVDRCRHFKQEFPNGRLNPTLLRKVYKQWGIKKKKLRWYKSPKTQDPEKQSQLLTNMKR